MFNTEIRQTAKNLHVTLWQLADHLGRSEATMTRLLRHELPAEDKKRLILAINEIAAENAKRQQPVA